MTDLLSQLDDLLAKMDPAKKSAIMATQEYQSRAKQVWLPNVGPQCQAYVSNADWLYFGGQAGGGKGASVDEVLPCPSGYIRMGDVKVGDTLFDQDGNTCTVNAVSPVSNRKCYSVKFDDGSEIVADDVHRWLTLTAAERLQRLCLTDEWRERRRAKRPSRALLNPQKPGTAAAVAVLNRERKYTYISSPQPSIRNTEEIASSVSVGKNGRLNHSIEIAGPINLPDIELPIEPYLLGLWLGDGTSANSYIGMMDADWKDIVHFVKSEVHSNIYPAGYVKPFRLVRFRGLLKSLKECGLIANKHIPPAYLRSSIEQRRELLRGLLDTDGHCDKRGRIEIGLSNRRLAEQTRELVCSLGIKCSLSTKYLSKKSNKWKDSHRLQFHADFPAFKLPRKLNGQLSRKRDTSKRHYIVSVTPIPSVPTKCISVDSLSHTYLIGRSFIPTHNTDLLLGLAMTGHQKSAIFRQAYDDLSALIDRLVAINQGRSGFTQSPHPKWTRGGRKLELGALDKPGAENSWQGRDHDFYGFDEGAQLSKDKILFVTGWLRSTDVKQRKRVVIASNPPRGGDGEWLIGWFAPWLDPGFADPAKPGELRWAIVIHGETQWVSGPGKTVIDGETYTHQSRTFIPSSLDDNPYLKDTGYRATIENMPEPIRSQLLYGDFMAGREDHEWQVIPTAWVKAAQERWRKAAIKHRRMVALSMDVSLGGRDDTTMAALHEDNWIAPLIKRRGVVMDDPANHASLLVMTRRDEADISMDATGGWGAGITSHLKHQHGIECHGIVYSKPSQHKAKDGTHKFKNIRAELYWRFREALSPDSEEDICLPPDPRLLSQLVTPRYKVVGQNIIIEDKDEIKKRIGASTDDSDAVVQVWSRRHASLRRARTVVPGLPAVEDYVPMANEPWRTDTWMVS